MGFVFKGKYGEYYGCQFEIARYTRTGNLAVEIWRVDGCVVSVTVNTDVKLPDDRIAIKDYSENEGMVDWLKSMDIIEPDPVNLISSGWVMIPVHKLTDHGKEIIGISK